jgi:hypothetical protein
MRMILGRYEHLTTHFELGGVSPLIVWLFLYSNSKYKIKLNLL